MKLLFCFQSDIPSNLDFYINLNGKLSYCRMIVIIGKRITFIFHLSAIHVVVELRKLELHAKSHQSVNSCRQTKNLLAHGAHHLKSVIIYKFMPSIIIFECLF